MIRVVELPTRSRRSFSLVCALKYVVMLLILRRKWTDGYVQLSLIFFFVCACHSLVIVAKPCRNPVNCNARWSSRHWIWWGSVYRNVECYLVTFMQGFHRYSHRQAYENGTITFPLDYITQPLGNKVFFSGSASYLFTIKLLCSLLCCFFELWMNVSFICNAPIISKYNSIDFFYFKFDRSSYSEKL
jgi:hypothetical protein